MMRNPIELKIISSNLEILEGRKRQLEKDITSVNAVIDKCKSWAEEKGQNQSTFGELLVLCGQTANSCHRCTEISTTVNSPETRTDDQSEILASSINTGTELYQKLLIKIDVLEAAVSSIKSSCQDNEDIILGVKKRCEDITSTVDQKLKKQRNLMKCRTNEIDAQYKNALVRIQENTEKIKSLSEAFTEAEENNHFHFDELYQEKSSANDLIVQLEKSLSSTTENLEALSSKFDTIENEMLPMKSNLKTLASSQEEISNLLKKSKREQNVKFMETDKKIGLTCALLTRKLETLRHQFEKVNAQEATNKKNIKLSESKLRDLTSKCESSYQHKLNGFYVKYVDYFPSGLIYADKARRDQRHEDNLRKMLSFDLNDPVDWRYYYVDSCLNRGTSTFTAPSDGIYIVTIRVQLFETNIKSIHVGLLRKVEDKIAYIESLHSFAVVNNTAKCNEIILLREGDEICFYTEYNKRLGTERLILSKMACVKLL